MKLYDLLMTYDYDGYSDYRHIYSDGLELKSLTVKINGEYFYLPYDRDKRLEYLKEELLNLDVEKVCIQPLGSRNGDDIALKIFT